MQLTRFIFVLKIVGMLCSYRNVKKLYLKETRPGYDQERVCSDNLGQNI